MPQVAGLKSQRDDTTTAANVSPSNSPTPANFPKSTTAEGAERHVRTQKHARVHARAHAHAYIPIYLKLKH